MLIKYLFINILCVNPATDPIEDTTISPLKDSYMTITCSLDISTDVYTVILIQHSLFIFLILVRVVEILNFIVLN